MKNKRRLTKVAGRQIVKVRSADRYLPVIGKGHSRNADVCAIPAGFVFEDKFQKTTRGQLVQLMTTRTPPPKHTPPNSLKVEVKLLFVLKTSTAFSLCRK